ncbi:MAG: hypothetical protein EXR71_08245 [Myxococcales bacterium]|nr:hypothetical protein [Myxococcales bacterium]
MSLLADLRSRPLPSRFGAMAPEVRSLLRVMGVMVFVAAAISVHLWTRTQVRETAVVLDRTRSELVRARTHHDRLLVERTMLRAPGRLGALAVAMDLEAPAAVVDVVSAGDAP